MLRSSERLVGILTPYKSFVCAGRCVARKHDLVGLPDLAQLTAGNDGIIFVYNADSPVYGVLDLMNYSLKKSV